MRSLLISSFLLGVTATVHPIYERERRAQGKLLESDLYDEVHEWEDFKARWGKRYADEAEEAYRFSVFQISLKRAAANNAVNRNAGGGNVFGVTRFSDRTQEEFDRANKGRKGHSTVEQKTGRSPRIRQPTGSSTPVSIDWAALGYTTPVKNQGQCGSCWAFSATEQIESTYMLAGYAAQPLSAQQITSCTEYMYGCGGGDTTYAYEQIISGETKSGMKTYGLASEFMAPYQQSMTTECLHRKCTVACDDGSVRDDIGNLTLMGPDVDLTGYYVPVTSYSYATPPCSAACRNQNLTALTESAAESPVSICVNAANWSDYVGSENDGVMTEAVCGGESMSDLDHCVQLVGYDMDASNPYFLVRNSWATTWGLEGFIKLSATGNTCGLANEATLVDIDLSYMDDA